MSDQDASKLTNSEALVVCALLRDYTEGTPIAALDWIERTYHADALTAYLKLCKLAGGHMSPGWARERLRELRSPGGVDHSENAPGTRSSNSRSGSASASPPSPTGSSNQLPLEAPTSTPNSDTSRAKSGTRRAPSGS